MKNIFYILAISFLFASCATVMNKKSYSVNIISNVEKANIEIFDTTYNLPASVPVERSKNDLLIKLKTDILTVDYTVKASKNSAFLFGNILFAQGAPVGYLVDLTNNKRFYYGHTIFLNTDDTTRTLGSPIKKYLHDYFTHDYPKNKGDLDLHLSLPYVNSFLLVPKEGGTKTNTGFWGLTIGLDYWYVPERFISIRASANADLFFPAPGAIDYIGEHDFLSTTYLSFSHNHKLKRFTFGYGIAYSKNIWSHRYFGGGTPPAKEPVTKRHNAIGLNFPIYYQFGDHFYTGMVYRPTFFRPGRQDKFKYEHLISLDFAWKIRLKKRPIP